MAFSTIFTAAAERLGMSPAAAAETLSLLKSLAVSPKAFREWDERLDAEKTAMFLKEFRGPNGVEVARFFLSGAFADFRYFGQRVQEPLDPPGPN